MNTIITLKHCSKYLHSVQNLSSLCYRLQDQRDRRRHSSADDFRTRVLERRALERKDSNHSESSECSQEVRGVLRKDSSHSDSTDSRSEVKLDESVFEHADRFVKIQ
jgi:hypothetical protein